MARNMAALSLMLWYRKLHAKLHEARSSGSTKLKMLDTISTGSSVRVAMVVEVGRGTAPVLPNCEVGVTWWQWVGLEWIV